MTDIDLEELRRSLNLWLLMTAMRSKRSDFNCHR
jgi:hypothetical protein